MATSAAARERELEHEIALVSFRSHEMHMRHIYMLRWGGLALAALTIVVGAVMIFMGLQGSFNWAVEAPSTVTAKLTNASPGIVFATIGMVLGFVVVIQKPVNYTTNPDGRCEALFGASDSAPKRSSRGTSLTLNR